MNINSQPNPTYIPPTFDSHLKKLEMYGTEVANAPLEKKTEGALTLVECKAAIATTILNIENFLSAKIKKESIPKEKLEQLNGLLKKVKANLTARDNSPVKKSLVQQFKEKIWKPKESVDNQESRGDLNGKIQALDEVVKSHVMTYKSNREECQQIIKKIGKYEQKTANELSDQLDQDSKEMYKSNTMDYKDGLYQKLKDVILNTYFPPHVHPENLTRELNLVLRDIPNSLFDPEVNLLDLIRPAAARWIEGLKAQSTANKEECLSIAHKLKDKEVKSEINDKFFEWDRTISENAHPTQTDSVMSAQIRYKCELMQKAILEMINDAPTLLKDKLSVQFDMIVFKDKSSTESIAPSVEALKAQFSDLKDLETRISTEILEAEFQAKDAARQEAEASRQETEGQKKVEVSKATQVTQRLKQRCLEVLSANRQLIGQIETINPQSKNLNKDKLLMKYNLLNTSVAVKASSELEITLKDLEKDKKMLETQLHKEQQALIQKLAKLDRESRR